MSEGRKAKFSTAELRQTLERLAREATQADVSASHRRTLEREIRDAVVELGELLRQLDPVAEPMAVFDPSNPKVVGRFVALALVAQPRCPLDNIPRSYGSGIYAFYYRGRFPDYRPISGTETPIYVGTAAPALAHARTPYEQGPRLTDRIRYHSRNIAKAATTLSIVDFDYRALVVQSGWERQAENYLIHFFHPIWNKETKLLFGFGKHGDRATTRQHGRSPWDTLHPARKWAGNSETDQRSPAQIRADLKQHFKIHPSYQAIDGILADFLEELRQM